MNVPLCCPDISDVEVEFVTKVLRSGQLSLGPCLTEFENSFAARVGAKRAVAVNSGTSALHLAVRALNIGAGDEVITTSFSFVASSNCLLFERALPVFLDIDRSSFNLDPGEIQRFIQQWCVEDPVNGLLTDLRTGLRVRAILPVHVFGLPCEMDPILELATRYKLHVIEDACEALGSQYKGRNVGTLGDIGVFAFYPNKQMTTGEGGMIVTNNEDIAVSCRSMRNQGRAEDASWLSHERLGYNYRLSDIHCALGLAQLKRLDNFLAGRARVAMHYQRALAGHPLISLPHAGTEFHRSWFVYPIQLRLDCDFPGRIRDQVLRQLRAHGIGCQSYFPAIHLQPYFRQQFAGVDYSLPETERASDTCIALPMFPSATEEQIAYICSTLLEVVEAECGANLQPENKQVEVTGKLSACIPS